MATGTMRRAGHRLRFTIDAAGTLSNAQNIEGHVILSILHPAAWTAADLQFLGSVDGVTFAPVYDDAGTRVKVASAALPAAEARMLVNKAILEQLAGLTWVKFEASSAQAAERVIEVVLKA